VSFLLDTMVVSETRKTKPHGGVMAWLRATPEELQLIPTVTFWELQRGIDRTRASDPAKADEIERWMEGLLASARIVAVTGPMFRQFQILARRHSDENVEDMLIAASAIVAGLTVATRNVRHFAAYGVPTLNPWDYRG
jgi:toxin FitB